MKFGLTMIPGIDWSQKLEAEQDEAMKEYEMAKARSRKRLEMTANEQQQLMAMLRTDPVFRPKTQM